jgi:hypothetical protein
MQTLAPRPRTRKPARSIRLLARPGDGASRGCLEITVGPLRTTYHLERIPSDWGTAFELTKFLAAGGEAYHVNLDPLAEGGLRTSCDCLGHLQHGHCKHAEGLLALCRAGRL